MKSLIILVGVAVVGTTFAGWSISKSHQLPPVAQPVVPPPTSSFAATVAGAGIVEPQGHVVRIGSPIGEVIAEVLVTPGAVVKAGDVLLRLDDRQIKASEHQQLAALVVAKAALVAARVERDAVQDQANRINEAIMSAEERSRRSFALAGAEARIAQADAAVSQADSAVAAVRTELERRAIRAPSDGTILRVDARAGEFAAPQVMDPPLITMGDLSRLLIRVDIDENDSWRVVPGVKAQGIVRGNPDLTTPLEFVRIDPYVVPKKSLTGLSAERVDTRVLQVIFAIGSTDLHVYPGQQMDVFMDAATTKPAAPAGP